MATPKEMIRKPGFARDSRAPRLKVYEKIAEWEGVKIGHYRVEPGQMSEMTNKTHVVFVPIHGSVTIESLDEGDAPSIRRGTVGHASIEPVGLRYSAHWEEELDYVSVFLTEEFLKRQTVDFEANRNAAIVHACGTQDPLVRSIALALADELDAEQPAGKLYAESLVNALAVHLLRHYSTDSLVADLQFGGLPAHKLRRVTEFVEENLDQDLALVEIASAAELSPYHFARSFKQTTGFTPIQFLMQRRIERAKQLLSASGLPLAEIALNVGFKNQSHFTTLFRKLTEMTPGAWRNAFSR